jgi:hypothetical protein
MTISREDVVDEDRRQLEEVEGGRKAAGKHILNQNV